MIQFIKDHPMAATHRIMRYEELDDLVQYIETHPISANTTTRGHFSRGYYWFGRDLVSLDNVKQLIHEPWPEGQRIADQMYDEMMTKLPQPKSIKRLRRWSEDAGEVDCDRIMRGEAEYMREIYKDNVNTESTNIALVLDLSGMSCESKDAIFWRGAASAALVDHLEAAGYSCEIWVYTRADSAYKRGPYNCFSYRKLKSAGESFDRQKLIIGTSTWVFRGLIHGYRETYWDVKDNLGQSHKTFDGFEDLFDIGPDLRLFRFNPMVDGAVRAVEEAKRIMCEVTGAVPEHA